MTLIVFIFLSCNFFLSFLYQSLQGSDIVYFATQTQGEVLAESNYEHWHSDHSGSVEMRLFIICSLVMLHSRKVGSSRGSQAHLPSR